MRASIPARAGSIAYAENQGYVTYIGRTNSATNRPYVRSDLRAPYQPSG